MKDFIKNHQPLEFKNIKKKFPKKLLFICFKKPNLSFEWIYPKKPSRRTLLQEHSLFA